jgi:hypothetical protein
LITIYFKVQRGQQASQVDSLVAVEEGDRLATVFACFLYEAQVASNMVLVDWGLFDYSCE